MRGGVWLRPGLVGVGGKAGLPGKEDCLGAVFDVKLDEDRREIVSHGLLADPEALSDGVVAHAVTHEFEDLAFPYGEFWERRNNVGAFGLLGELR